MNITLSFIRIFFVLLSVLFFTAFFAVALSGGSLLLSILIGLIVGGIFGVLLIGTDNLFRRFNLRSFNIAALGLFCGYLMGQAIMLIFSAVLDLAHWNYTEEVLTFSRITIYLFSIYLGMVMTARASEELYVSIPFVKFKPGSNKKKDILLDPTILQDSRVIDLATSGLLDHHLILPRFTLKELYANLECNDENLKSKARRCLDVVKRLEAIPTLDLRYADTDFPEIKDPTAKLIRLARLLDANIITADINRIQQSSIESIEGIRVINIHMLSNALKPISHAGEYITIKIQRYGKEPRQGVGYLEDGTMVVVNGGAEFIGDAVKAQVLSVKHTSSGRMIFCNASTEPMDDGDGLSSSKEFAQTGASIENSHKNYFAL
jgi:uncharacterized protein YacL